MKFKTGDYIIGTRLADVAYFYTNSKAIMRVEKVLDEYEMLVKIVYVENMAREGMFMKARVLNDDIYFELIRRENVTN